MKKIMLVDDVAISNFIMKKMIAKVSSGYEIYDYTLPQKALADMNEINPDIIFLDLNMPLIDGWEFLNRMQESNLQQPVFILTSSTSELDLQQSKNYSSVKNFLIKPIDMAILENALNSIFISTAII